MILPKPNLKLVSPAGKCELQRHRRADHQSLFHEHVALRVPSETHLVRVDRTHSAGESLWLVRSHRSSVLPVARLEIALTPEALMTRQRVAVRSPADQSLEVASSSMKPVCRGARQRLARYRNHTPRTCDLLSDVQH